MSYTPRSTYEFISQQTSDPIIEWRTCAVSGTEFPIFQSDRDFLDKISPTFDGQQFILPLPILCPEERERRRLVFRNERNLYRRKCSASGADIISNYSPDKPYKIYDRNVWWGDAWNPMTYAQDADFSNTFTEQYRQLYLNVPRPSAIIVASEQSDYNNHCGYLKNCYMCFDVGRLEDCLYVSRSYYNKRSMDVSFTGNCENCYDLVESFESTNCSFSFMLSKCYDCNRCYDCQGCSSCFLCSNLVNSSYCIQNQQYTKEEYFMRIEDYKKYSFFELQGLYSSLLNNSLYSASRNLSCEEVIGNNLKNCSNSSFSFSVQDSEYMRYCEGESGCNYIMDDNFSGGRPIGSAQYSYMTVGCESGDNLLFCFSCWQGCSHLLYCDFCHGCSHCFGCVGLRNDSYCIFNKQYTKEEYEQIVAKIIVHMQQTGERGEFFHPSLSPFGYNETVAQEYYPLTSSEFLEPTEKILGTKNGDRRNHGYKRSHYSADPKIPEGVQTIKRKNYSDAEWKYLRDDDEILKKILICEISDRPYRLVKQELEFYRRHALELPTKHPDIRHVERMQCRPGKTLYVIDCCDCHQQILSVYLDKENVLCQSCYQKRVYA